MTAWCLLLILACCSYTAAKTLQNFEETFYKNHNNIELANVLKNVNKKCPHITRVYDLSEHSVLGMPLLVIEFAKQPGVHKQSIPEVKLTANIHADEVLGREMLLRLAVFLCDEYTGRNKEVISLVENTRLHIIPSMNPDGWSNTMVYRMKGVGNMNGVDLNLNFPDLTSSVLKDKQEKDNLNFKTLTKLTTSAKDIAPETKAMMEQLQDIPFVLSASFFEGNLVSVYPYNLGLATTKTQYSKTPDDETFRYLASSYSKFHSEMSDPKKSCPGSKFPGGITNGAAWKSASRSMMDYNYLASNNFEIAVYLGCDKSPRTSAQLEEEWRKNQKPLLNFLWQAHIGFKGIVADAITKEVINNAAIQVRNVTRGRDDIIMHDIQSGVNGDFFRLLTDGKYNVTISAPNYMPESRIVTVNNRKQSIAKVLLVVLKKIQPEKA